MTPRPQAEYERLFMAASRLAGKERERFLDRECQGEPEVRQAVEALLANMDDSGSARRPAPTLRDQIAGSEREAQRRWLGVVERAMRLLQPPRGPLLVLGFLVVTGYWSYDAIREGLEQTVEEALTTYLNNNVSDLELLVDMRGRVLDHYSSEPTLRAEARELVREFGGRDVDAQTLRSAPQVAAIRAILEPLKQTLDVHGFCVVEPSGRILVAGDEAMIGRRLSAVGLEILAPAFRGEMVRQAPIARSRLVADFDESVLVPVTFGAEAVVGEADRPQAVLALIYESKPVFERMFRAMSGEQDWDVFAFDATGTLISGTIHLPQLKALGLVPDEPGVSAALRLQLRDPGGDLTEGFENDAPVDTWPLTQMAAAAIAGESGVDLDGYRNVLGLDVLGAWTWLPHYRIGIAVEFRTNRALETTRPLLLAFAALFIVIVLFTLVVMSLSFAMRVMRERVEADKLGQYTLISKIGEGGMGTVYKARHSMLRRDTAVKILRMDSIDAENVARFEREVQTTSQLANPHTIEVYDYGHDDRTGAFFYAMEYLDGITLADLLASDGPQPAARVVHILKQACGSLAEAHEAGLIHRDIKPLNIMLCQRGGSSDVIKVLDFGLVTDIKPEGDGLSTKGVVKGTPLYIAPERVLDPAAVDARSDIYSLGTVAYNLLTAKEIFEGNSSAELLERVLHTEPRPPSECLGKPIDADLERLVMACLAKDPDQRPASMRAILAALDTLDSVPRWTQDEAGAWWRRYGAAHPPTAERSPGTAHTPITP